MIARRRSPGRVPPSPEHPRRARKRPPRLSAAASVLAAVLAVACLAALVAACARTSAAASPEPEIADPQVASVPADSELPAPVAELPAPYSGQPLVSSPRTLPVPILMYHMLAVAPPDARYPSLFVSPDEFVAQLRYLVTHGYHAVTLQKVYDFWHGQARLPERAVVLSFDDGNPTDFTVAAPLLEQLDWPGVLNLVVRNVADGSPLTPAMVRTLIDAGWEIDSHSIQHRDLTRLSPAEVQDELAGSREELSRLFDAPANFFCYPGGRVNRSVAAAVRAAGYLAATTSHSGVAGPRQGMYRLARVRVTGGESLAAFAASLKGGR